MKKTKEQAIRELEAEIEESRKILKERTRVTKLRNALEDIHWENHLQDWEKTLETIEKLERKHGQ